MEILIAPDLNINGCTIEEIPGVVPGNAVKIVHYFSLDQHFFLLF